MSKALLPLALVTALAGCHAVPHRDGSQTTENAERSGLRAVTISVLKLE